MDRYHTASSSDCSHQSKEKPARDGRFFILIPNKQDTTNDTQFCTHYVYRYKTYVYIAITPFYFLSVESNCCALSKKMLYMYVW